MRFYPPFNTELHQWILQNTQSLDLETFSSAGYKWDEETSSWKSIAQTGKAGIAAVGAAAYAYHPSTEVLMFSYGGRSTKTWMKGDPEPKELTTHIQNGGIVSGQNVMFEYWNWNQYFHKKFGWPKLELWQLIDTAAICKAYGAPGKLEKAGEILLPEHLQKLKSGNKLIQKFSVPKKPTKKQPERKRIHLHEEPLEALRFAEYNQFDVFAERGLLERCPPLIPEETRIWEIDAGINDRGVQIDVDGLKKCLQWVNYHTALGNAELAKLTGGYVEAATELSNIGRWVEWRGVQVPRTKKYSFNLDDETISKMLQKPLAPDIHRVLELRQNLAGAAVKKLFAMERTMCPDKRLRGMFEYWGAHTGRWAGKLVQLHNQPPSLEPPKGINYDEFIHHIIFNTSMSMKDVKGCLRGLQIAAPGKELISSDYNAIEAVVTAVLANEEWRLEVFRTHGKIYEESASKITGVPFEDFMAHKKETGNHHPLRNKIGKYAELASGFGGWIPAWKNFGADKHLSDNEIKNAILAWREASPKIVELWGGQWRQIGYKNFKPEWFGLEGAWIQAMHTPYQPVNVGAHLSGVYYPNEDVLRIWLPSGRALVYRQPRLGPGTHNFSKNPQYELSYLGYKEGQLKRIVTYGGRLTENVVQAIARDILRDAMILLTDNHYPIVLHVHDEPTAEVPTGFGSIEEFEAIMLTESAWWRGWPVRASGGWRGKRYRK